MSAMILWWAGVEGLGIICLPLAAMTLAHLPDRGWLLAKPLGLLLWCYLIWLPLVTMPALPYSRGFLIVALIVFLLINVALLPRTARPLGQVLRRHWGYLAAGEGVFAGTCALLAWVRAFTPDIAGTEKFMDAAFVSAIWRAPHLPPPDPWLSGYAINYYYFGHFIIATLAKLLGTMPAIAFNTGICIVFGLTAIAVYSVTGNAVAAGQRARQQAMTRIAAIPAATHSWVSVPASSKAKRAMGVDPPETVTDRPSADAAVGPDRQLLSVAPEMPGGILAPSEGTIPGSHLLRAAPAGIFAVVLVLLLGNLAGAQQWLLHRADWASYNWWDPSRVIPDTINEFPAFSFLLADLHAHVLALPFAILTLGFALHILLGRETGLRALGEGLAASVTGLVAAIALGALYVMNGWDLPTYLGIAGICLALQQWVAHGRCWSLALMRDVVLLAAGLALLCIVLYLPFYQTFSSPAQGIGIVTPPERTPPGDLALIFGTQALLAAGLLVMLAAQAIPALYARIQDLWSSATTSGRMALALWALVLLVVTVEAGIILVVRANGATLLLGLGVMLLCALLLGTAQRQGPDALFALVLIGIAGVLVALCEIIYLRDVFASSLPRMNTVFKFYFQAWALLGVGGAGALWLVLARSTRTVASNLSPLMRALRGSLRAVWVAGLLVLMLGGAVYPVLGTYVRTGHLAQLQGLDGSRYLEVQDPGDYAAIQWLNQHVSGEAVIVEASGGEYTSFARIATFTGLPTVMGWYGHELQWRINWLRDPAHNADFARRLADLDRIYTNNDQQMVLDLLHRYHAQYLYVGPLEQQKYPGAQLERFRQFLPVVYSSLGVTIYAVPSS